MIDVIGTDDRTTVTNWYLDQYQIEEIQSTDGAVTQNQIAQLVSAMASFDRPAAGSIVSAEVAAQLRPVITSAWDIA